MVLYCFRGTVYYNFSVHKEYAVLVKKHHSLYLEKTRSKISIERLNFSMTNCKRVIFLERMICSLGKLFLKFFHVDDLFLFFGNGTSISKNCGSVRAFIIKRRFSLVYQYEERKCKIYGDISIVFNVRNFSFIKQIYQIMFKNRCPSIEP